MLPVVVRARHTFAALAVAAITAGLAGCSLGDSSVPPFTDPATQVYDTSTHVSIAAMTRVNSQVYSQDVVVGTGRVLGVGDSISVYYSGRLTGGYRFDYRARPSTPFTSVLDTLRIIHGWVDGLAGMKVGGTRRLAIGPGSAYGFTTVRDTSGNVIIPANSVITFDVEVIGSVAKAQ